MSALRDKLLAATARRYATLYVPELDCKVAIRSLTESERSAYEMKTLNAKSQSDIEARREDSRRRLIVLTICDPDSKELLFSEMDVVELEELDSAIALRLYHAALKHTGCEDETPLEDLEKN